MRILSGMQPSGNLHLGNYFGMMRPMLEYQKSSELFCFIVNYHALTTSREGAALAEHTLEAAADFLALGLDPEKSVFWVQSDVPEVTELAWILSTVTGMGLLERCHSYKDKLAQGLKPNHGLFAYPVLMAADILMMRAEKVPVGADQKQHVEVAQDVAERFNSTYGAAFTVPQPEIQAGGRMLPGTDGRKMSKSYDNTIEIFCDRETLRRKIAGFKTDSAPAGQGLRDASENTLFQLYGAFLDEPGRAALKKRFESPGLKYSEVKPELADFIWNYFEPFRAKRDELKKDPGKVIAILKKGADKARAAAASTLADVRRRVGLDYAAAGAPELRPGKAAR
jgi:tryptophanyl-tRNA synthetase